MATPDGRHPGGPPVKAARRSVPVMKILMVLLLVAIIALASIALSRHNHLQTILLWVEENQVAGGFVFITIYVVCTVLFIPPSILSVAAGAVFGFWIGSALVWTGGIIGESLSFLVGRFLFQDFVREKTRQYPSWLAVEAALREDGWKVVALLRVSPLLPFTVLNYALGVSSLPFSQYFWPSTIGILPTTVVFVYLGTLAKDLTALMQHETEASPPKTAQIIFFVVSAVLCCIVLVAVGYYAKRALQKKIDRAITEERRRDSEDGGSPLEVLVGDSEELPLLHTPPAGRRIASLATTLTLDGRAV